MTVHSAIQAMLYLLDRGSDVNAIDVAGNTALHHCVCVDPEDEVTLGGCLVHLTDLRSKGGLSK